MYQVLESSTLQLSFTTNNNLLSEAICYFQICNIAESEVAVSDTCVPRPIVIDTTVDKSQFTVSLKQIIA